MIVTAHAKINLTLNVVKKRDDGYHELDMIMLPLTLHDDLTIEVSKEDCFTSDDPLVSMDEHNTVVKAVWMMRKEYGVKECFKIHLHKRIPSQAGLAGGSADAAAVLRGINELLDLQIPVEELSLKAKQIGADVPFCVMQKGCLVQGIGEKLTPFTMDWHPYVLLVKPSVGVSTKEAFQTLDFTKCPHPDATHIMHLLQTQKYDEVYEQVANSLEYSAFRLVGEIAHIKEQLKQDGFPCVLMSGSGSCVFAISDDLDLITRVMPKYEQQDYFVCKTSFL